MNTRNTTNRGVGVRSLRETLHLALVAGLAVGLLVGQAYCLWQAQSLLGLGAAATDTRAPAGQAQPTLTALSTLDAPRNP